MSPEETPPVERVFRIHVGVDLSFNASTGRTTYFTSYADLRVAVLAARLDILEKERISTRDRQVQTTGAKGWRRIFRIDRGLDPDESHPRVKTIYRVQQFHEGAWHDLEPQFTDPDCVLVGVR